MLRRGRTLISSHFPNALADGSGGDIAFSVSSHGWGRATRGFLRAEKFSGEGDAGYGKPSSAFAQWGSWQRAEHPWRGPATLALHQSLGPLWDWARLQIISTKAFTGP